MAAMNGGETSKTLPLSGKGIFVDGLSREEEKEMAVNGIKKTQKRSNRNHSR